jgi:hypothetical protein
MKRFLTAVVGIFVLTAPIFAPPANAKCKKSCTEIAAICVTMGASQAACNADMSHCLKTGKLHMPSGRTFKNLCKR